METTTLALLLLVPLLVWRIYSRLKKLVARQKSQLWRHWSVAIAFPALLLFLATTTKFEVLPLSSLGGAALAGGWLGVLGLKLTRFEQVGKDFFLPSTATWAWPSRCCSSPACCTVAWKST